MIELLIVTVVVLTSCHGFQLPRSRQLPSRRCACAQCDMLFMHVLNKRVRVITQTAAGTRLLCSICPYAAKINNNI